MDKQFQIDGIGKRMPYTTPDNFFDTMKDGMLRQVGCGSTAAQQGVTRRRGRRTLLGITIGALAAAAAALLLFTTVKPEARQPEVGFNEVVAAYENLSEADQAYIASVYQDDIFMNEDLYK